MTKTTRAGLMGVAWMGGCAAIEPVGESSWRSGGATEVDAQGDETSAWEAASDAVAPAIDDDAYPESGECGYVRSIDGEVDGHRLYGEPRLEQDSCSSGSVCGRPALDICTAQETAHFTCGCVPTAVGCDARDLAPLLASADFRLRDDATRRAKDCCLQLPYPQWVDGLGAAVAGLEPPSPEASARYLAIGTACLPRCTARAMALSTGWACDLQEKCRGGLDYEFATVGEDPDVSCTCTCVVPRPE